MRSMKLLALTATAAASATVTYNGPPSGKWFEDPSNWSGSSFPKYPADVEVTKPVTLATNARGVAKLLELDEWLTVENGAQLEVGPTSCLAPPAEFLAKAATPTSDSDCRVPSECVFRHTESAAPTATADRVCAYDCAANECFVGAAGSRWNDKARWSNSQLPSYPDGAFVDKHVAVQETTRGSADELEIGPDGFIEVTASGSDDVFLEVGPRSCTADQREIYGPTLTKDRVCQKIVICKTKSGEEEWESKKQTATEPRECTPWTECKKVHEYETSPPDGFNDRKCATTKDCEAGEEQSAAPTATADRQCKDCKPGHAGNPNGGNTARCAPCPNPTFMPTAGQPKCRPCPSCGAGKIRVNCGLQHVGTCETCEPGMIKKDQFTCSDCRSGTFEHLNTQCGECFAGRHSEAKATECTSCKVGFFSAQDGASQCTSCKGWTSEAGKSQLLGSHAVAGHTGCQAHATCDYDVQYETVAAGPQTNRVCEDATVCLAGEVEIAKLMTSSDRKCRTCRAGHACPGGAAPETACRAGTFQESPGKATCNTCKNCASDSVYQGTCAGASAGKCSQCTAGSIKVGSDWSAKCKACEIGHFETRNRQLCKACTPGRFAGSAGSTRCKSCATGLFADASKSSECKTCGCATCTRYAHTTGADLPSHVLSFKLVPAGHTDCSAHTVCDAVLEYETGAAGPITNRECTVARICVAGEYESSPLKATANRECQPCPIGSKCAGGAAPIVPCTGKTYQNRAGQDHCKDWYDCNQHQYETRTPSASRDRICASHKHCSKTEYETVEGSYSSDRSCATLTRCDPGFKETVKPVHVFRHGSHLNRKCDKCDTGKFMPDSDHAKDACVKCPLGRAEDSKGSALCDRCLPGTAQDTLGQTTCKPCTTHFFQPAWEQAKCKPCDYMCARGLIHKGCGVDKAGSCQQCAGGHYKKTKSVRRSCAECPTGYVQPKKGQWKCNACEGGQFQDTKAQLTCKTCDYTCPTGEQHLGCGGSENGGCQQCTPGRHKDGANEKNDLQLCSDCAPGTFHPKHGASTCKSCITGRYQPSSKQTECLDCLVIAATCKIGEYHSGCGSNKPGTCPECDAGTFKAKAGVGSCSDCAAGRSQDKPGQGDCKDCDGPLFFQTKTGEKNCNKCNYKCPIGNEHTACGSANEGHCYKCQAGRAKNNAVGEKPGGADRCEACKPGNYQDETGQGTCKACDGFNEWQPDAHATFCLRTRVCSKTEYETVAPTKSSNRECASHTTCDSSQYQTRPANTHFDRICALLTVGNSAKQWESRAAGATFDRQFKTATVCKSSEFEVAPLKKTSDRVCKMHRVCHKTKEWETKKAGLYTNRECATHTKCTSTEWETKSKGTKHDRECSMLQVCPNLTCKEDTGMMFVQHHHTDHEVGFKYHRCGITNAKYEEAPGADNCASGLMIDTVAECRRAAQHVGRPFVKAVRSKLDAAPGARRPAGCFWDQNGSVYFNEEFGAKASWGGVGGLCHAVPCSKTNTCKCTCMCDSYKIQKGAMPKQRYTKKLAGTCGVDAITSKAECERAAASINHQDKAATTIGWHRNHAYWHKGCFIHLDGRRSNNLYFNTHPNAAKECSTTHPCICKKAPTRKPCMMVDCRRGWRLVGADSRGCGGRCITIKK